MHSDLQRVSVRKIFILSLMFGVWFSGSLCGITHELSMYAQHACKSRGVKRRREPIIDSILEPHSWTPFLDETGWDELDIPIVHNQIDYAQTSFGRWQLKQFLHPTTNIETVRHRQDVIKKLLNDPQFFESSQKALMRVARSEGALIAYWNEQDHLSARAQDLYFTFPWVSRLNKHLNESKAALDVNMVLKSIRRCDSLFIELCKVSVAKELLKLSVGLSTNISIEGVLLNNVKSLFRSHIPWYVKYNSATYSGDLREYSDLLENGSMADRWAAYLRGATFEQGEVTLLEGDGYLKKGWDNTVGIAWGATFGKLFPNFSIGYQWSDEKVQNISDHSLGKKGLVALGALGYTACLDYALYTGSRDSFRAIQSLFSLMNRLRARLVDVALAVKAVRALERHVSQYPTICEYPFAQKMKQVRAARVSPKLKLLLEMLHEKTFEGEDAWAYSRGRVLLAHKLLLEIKQELVPVLEAVAEFDAYVSLATLIKEHENQDAHFSFVEFIDSQEPVIRLNGCWELLIASHRAVKNDIAFGNGQPNKLVITGPNGGGKSTFLKAAGHAMVLAQSFGIVPAASAQITPCAQLRTCLRPQESLLDDMSQFMAEKKRMDEMQYFVQRCTNKHKVVALIDEPFRGTVDAESAERIYDFGQLVAQKPGSVVCIATHVHKPTLLAQDTKGIFGNCHVAIAEHENGIFERLFEVHTGCERWWFDDAGKRSRFIDWLSTQY